MSERQEKLYKIIGSMLRQARLDRGMTLETAGDKLGVIAKTIQRYETGERKIGLNKLMELTVLYGIDYSTFMDYAEKRLLAEEKMEEEDTVLHSKTTLSDMESRYSKLSKYYLDDEVAKIAQEVYERPELRMLFSASRNVSADDLKAVIALVDRMKKEDE